MNSRRDYRGSRPSLFDGIEEGINRAASSSYSNLEISEHDNDAAMDGLQDKVNILKRITTDIHQEVQSQNRMLDFMGSHMDTSRGMLAATAGRFKKVFERKRGKSWLIVIMIVVAVMLVSATKSRRILIPLVSVLVILFLLVLFFRRK